MAIIGTPITSPGLSAYVSVADADTFFLARLTGSSTWSTATTVDKVDALNQATAVIDALPLAGDRYEDKYIENGVQTDINNDGLTQLYEFPRIIDGVTCDYDNATELPIVPQAVKDACCWMALSLIEEDTSEISEKTLQEAGVQSFSLGKLSMSFKGGAANDYCGLPKRAYDLLKKYIEQTPAII